jgi:hypothetical protein
VAPPSQEVNTRSLDSAWVAIQGGVSLYMDRRLVSDSNSLLSARKMSAFGCFSLITVRALSCK